MLWGFRVSEFSSQKLRFVSGATSSKQGSPPPPASNAEQPPVTPSKVPHLFLDHIRSQFLLAQLRIGALRPEGLMNSGG